MGFRLQRGESVNEGVKRIAREQLEKAVAEIQNHGLGPPRGRSSGPQTLQENPGPDPARAARL